MWTSSPGTLHCLLASQAFALFSKKIVTKETVSVITEVGHVFVVLPTSDTEYDVRKQLDSSHHFGGLSNAKTFVFGIWIKKHGRRSVVGTRSRVTKVVTGLGFQVEHDDTDEIHFVRYVSNDP